MNKNIIFFLDIDGVLIHSKSPRRPYFTFDTNCVQRLRTATEKYEALIVISSCVRRQDDWKERTISSFQKAGWDNPPIIGRTPISPENIRGAEIELWLSRQLENYDYVIIDDEMEDQTLPKQKGKVVKTKGYEGGLQDKHLEEIDNILKITKTAY